MMTPTFLKMLAAAAVFGLPALLNMGCAQNQNTFTDTDWVPGYSLQENGERVARYEKQDAEQFMDDVDKDLFMLRPASKLTWWNVTQTD